MVSLVVPPPSEWLLRCGAVCTARSGLPIQSGNDLSFMFVHVMIYCATLYMHQAVSGGQAAACCMLAR